MNSEGRDSRAGAWYRRARFGARVLLAHVLLSAGGGDAAAQVVNFRHYTSAEGMPQAQVLAVTQDRHGYMWFATYGGLSRFDGSEFRTFEAQDGLGSNSVWDVVEDGTGRMLIATSRGVCVRDNDTFRCWRQSDGLGSDNARSVAGDASGGIWVGTWRGVSYVKGETIRNYTMADGLPAERVGRVVVDARGGVWAATENGLARLEGERFVPHAPTVLGGVAVHFIARAGEGLLIGAGNRIYLRQGEALVEVAPDAIPVDAAFTDGAVDRDGTIWVATRAGVLRVRDGRVDRLGRGNGLLTELVNRVTIDREGVVWFGTESGASKHVPGPFRTYTDVEGLPSTFVRAIAEDAAGRLWIGGRVGVAVREGERFRPVALTGTLDSRVYGLAPAPEGGMLVGTRRGLVHWVDGRSRVYGREHGLPGDVVYSMSPDGTGGVWLGTENGLAQWHNGRIDVVRPELEGMGLISMHRDRRGRLWLGRTEGGIAVLENDTVRFLGSDEGASDQTIWAIAEDAQGRIWAGSNGDGVLRIDSGAVRRFTVKDGLASNFIWQVLADRLGDVWVFGNLGLNRFSGDELAHYGRGSGLIELEGSAGASFEDHQGNLWFGTGSGVIRYAPVLDVRSAVALPIFIEEVTLDDQPFPIAGDGALRIGRGAVRIRFASPSFRDESATRFRYRIAGAGAPWSAPTAERSITYAGLAPGHYRFEVVAENRNRTSELPAIIEFEVLPAYWQTWWFRGGGVLLLLLAAAALPSVRAQGLERERRRLEALVAQHTRELAQKNVRLESSNRDLEYFAYVASHDLQEPLRKIQAFSDRVNRLYHDRLDEQGRDYLDRMVGAAARMQRLINDLLSLSRVTTRQQPMENVALDLLVQEVMGDLEIRIQSSGGRVDVGPLPLVHGDPAQFRQLFQNLIGNALKFHRPDVAPVVTLTATALDSHNVEIRVADNGIGFESKDAERVFLPFQRLHARAQYEGTGIGLAICQKIVERHGGAIRADSAPGEGTRFVITLPVLAHSGEKHAA